MSSGRVLNVFKPCTHSDQDDAGHIHMPYLNIDNCKVPSEKDYVMDKCIDHRSHADDIEYTSRLYGYNLKLSRVETPSHLTKPFYT